MCSSVPNILRSFCLHFHLHRATGLPVSCQVNLLPKMLITRLKLLIFWYAPFCAFWLYTVLPTQRFLLNYKVSTKWHMLARYLFHRFSWLCFLCVLLKPLMLLICFLSNCNVSLGITLQLFRSYQKILHPAVLTYAWALLIDCSDLK